MKKTYHILAAIILICIVSVSVISIYAQDYDINSASEHVHTLTYWCSGVSVATINKNHSWTSSTGIIHHCSFIQENYSTDVECRRCTYFDEDYSTHAEMHYGHSDGECDYMDKTTKMCSYPDP